MNEYRAAVNPGPGKGEIAVLFAGSEQTKSAHRVGPQVLDYALVHHVVSGEGRFQCLGKTYELRVGDSFFIFPGELVSYTSDEAKPLAYRWVGFKGTMAETWLSQAGITVQRPVVHLGRSSRRMAVLFHRIHRILETGGPGCDMEAAGVLRIALAEWSRVRGADMPASSGLPNETPNEQVNKAIRWMTLQYSQPISIEQLSQMFGYHRTHLSKLFKQHTGLSPQQFLLKIRMERAKTLLYEPLTIEQVASSVGFHDALHFSKQFKKWTGRSPSEFRGALTPGGKYICNP